MPAATVPVAVQYRGLPKPPSAIRPLGGCDVVMVPFGPDRKVLHGSDAPDHPKGATMPRTRLVAVGLAVALLVGACGGGGSDPAERDDEATSGASVTSEDESTQDARSGASTTAADEPLGAAQPAAATPVQLGERFGWCAKAQALWDAQDEARVESAAAAMAHEIAVGTYEAATDDLDRAEASEAVDDAYADYAFSARDYGQVRWDAAGLLLGDESVLLDRGQEDSTLQVAIERGSRGLPRKRHPTHAGSV